MLSAADMPAFLLDLATAPPAGPVGDWLASGPLSRSIGAVYSAEHAQKNYLQAADPLIFQRVFGRGRVHLRHRQTPCFRLAPPAL